MTKAFIPSSTGFLETRCCIGGDYDDDDMTTWTSSGVGQVLFGSEFGEIVDDDVGKLCRTITLIVNDDHSSCADDDDDGSKVLPTNFCLSPCGSENWKEERYWQASLYSLSTSSDSGFFHNNIIAVQLEEEGDKRRLKLNLKLRILQTNSNI